MGWWLVSQGPSSIMYHPSTLKAMDAVTGDAVLSIARNAILSLSVISQSHNHDLLYLNIFLYILHRGLVKIHTPVGGESDGTGDEEASLLQQSSSGASALMEYTSITKINRLVGVIGSSISSNTPPTMTQSQPPPHPTTYIQLAHSIIINCLVTIYDTYLCLLERLPRLSEILASFSIAIESLRHHAPPVIILTERSSASTLYRTPSTLSGVLASIPHISTSLYYTPLLSFPNVVMFKTFLMKHLQYKILSIMAVTTAADTNEMKQPNVQQSVTKTHKGFGFKSDTYGTVVDTSLSIYRDMHDLYSPSGVINWIAIKEKPKHVYHENGHRADGRCQCLCGRCLCHSDPSQLTIEASGTLGFIQLRSYLMNRPDECLFVVFRVDVCRSTDNDDFAFQNDCNDSDDINNNCRIYILLHWCGEAVNPLIRACRWGICESHQASLSSATITTVTHNPPHLDYTTTAHIIDSIETSGKRRRACSETAVVSLLPTIDHCLPITSPIDLDAATIAVHILTHVCHISDDDIIMGKYFILGLDNINHILPRRIYNHIIDLDLIDRGGLAVGDSPFRQYLIDIERQPSEQSLSYQQKSYHQSKRQLNQQDRTSFPRIFNASRIPSQDSDIYSNRRYNDKNTSSVEENVRIEYEKSIGSTTGTLPHPNIVTSFTALSARGENNTRNNDDNVSSVITNARQSTSDIALNIKSILSSSLALDERVHDSPPHSASNSHDDYTSENQSYSENIQLPDTLQTTLSDIGLSILSPLPDLLFAKEERSSAFLALENDFNSIGNDSGNDSYRVDENMNDMDEILLQQRLADMIELQLQLTAINGAIEIKTSIENGKPPENIITGDFNYENLESETNDADEFEGNATSLSMSSLKNKTPARFNSSSSTQPGRIERASSTGNVLTTTRTSSSVLKKLANLKL